MRIARYVLPGIAALLVACVTQQPGRFPTPTDSIPVHLVQIADRYDTITVTAETLGLEIQRCIASFGATSKAVTDTLATFPSPNTLTFGHRSSSRSFVLRQSTGLCLLRTPEGYPIFAAETFLDTVNPTGVPPDVTTAWYRQLAMLIAQQGVAKVAYVYGNGQAVVCSYWVEAHGEPKLSYSMEHRKQGAWEGERLDARFSHPNLNAVSSVKRGGQTLKSDPIAHRFR